DRDVCPPERLAERGGEPAHPQEIGTLSSSGMGHSASSRRFCRCNSRFRPLHRTRCLRLVRRNRNGQPCLRSSLHVRSRSAYFLLSSRRELTLIFIRAPP